MKWAWCVFLLACSSPHARPDAMAGGHPLGPAPLCPGGTPATVFEDFGEPAAGSGSCGSRGSFGATDMGSATSGDHTLTLTAQPDSGNTHGASSACAWQIAGSRAIIASGMASPASALQIGVRTTVSAIVNDTQMETTLLNDNGIITMHPQTGTWRRFGPSTTADKVEVDESVDGQTWSVLGSVPWTGGFPSSVELDFKLVTQSGDTAVFGPIYTCP